MMIKKPLCLAITMLSLTTGGFALNTSAMAESQPTLGTVNGQEYPLDLLQLFLLQATQNNPQAQTPEVQSKVLDEFMNIVVASQEAEKKALDKKPEVKTMLDLQRMQVLSQAELQSLIDDIKPTDAEISDAYKAVTSKIDNKEFKARHILLKNEAEAKDIIKQLNAKKGANFKELAKKSSDGPTAKDGGDLGWVRAETMVEPFAKALKELKKGEWSKSPVKTQFGWHVIQLEDIRKVEPPKLEEVKDQITMMVKQDKAFEGLKKLRDNAKVELNKDFIKTTPKEETKEKK